MSGLLDRFTEPSSYAGLSVLLGSIGLNLNPGYMQALTYGLCAIACAASVFLKEKGK